jgi:hypothetical protein
MDAEDKEAEGEEDGQVEAEAQIRSRRCSQLMAIRRN